MGNQYWNNPNTLKLIKELPRELGLKDTRIEVMESPGLGRELSMIMVSEMKIPMIELRRSDNISAEVFSNLTTWISELLLNSQPHKGIMKQKNKEIEELKAKVAELEKYKTHFDLQRAIITPVENVVNAEEK